MAVRRQQDSSGATELTVKTLPLFQASVIALSFVGLVAADDDDRRGDRNQPIPLTVPKAKCGPNDHPETALQGQVTAAMRAAGFKGFNCNLQLVGQVRGDGANWQTTQFKQRIRGQSRHDDDDDGEDDGNRTRVCGFHGTASATRSLPGRINFGVRVLDLTDLRNPTITTYLNSVSMHDPWESLKTNQRRRVLGADNARNGAGGPEIDIYDLSADCRTPQILASVAVGTGTDGSNVQAAIVGHEGNWAPDGLTYYVGNRAAQNAYAAIDTTDLTGWGNGHRTMHNGEERTTYADPDATWGHRSAIGTRAAG